RWAGRSRALASAAPERPAEGREARVRPRPAGGRSGRSHPPQERVHRPSGAPSSRTLHPARDAERLRDRARPLDRQEGLPHARARRRDARGTRQCPRHRQAPGAPVPPARPQATARLPARARRRRRGGLKREGTTRLHAPARRTPPDSPILFVAHLANTLENAADHTPDLRTTSSPSLGDETTAPCNHYTSAPASSRPPARSCERKFASSSRRISPTIPPPGAPRTGPGATGSSAASSVSVDGSA